MGAQNIFVFTKANSYGVLNNFAEQKYPELFEESDNKWLVSGNISSAKPTFDEVNNLLRSRGCLYRVRTPHLFVTRVLNE